MGTGMIGSIGNGADITVYLGRVDLKRMQDGPLQGTLIDIRKPQIQTVLELRVEQEKVHPAYTAWCEREKTKTVIYLGEHGLAQIMAGEAAFGRYLSTGSKIYVYDRNQLDTLDRLSCENLLFYKRHRKAIEEAYQAATQR
jgi:hypothetical protein